MIGRRYVGERLLMPIGLALGALLFIGLLTFSVSRILLAVGKEMAVAIGIVAAAAIVLAGAATAYSAGGELRRRQVIAVGLAGVLLVGSGIVAGAVVGEAPLHEQKTDAAHGGEPTPGPTAANDTVEVLDNEYDPKDITVPPGTTVLWEQTGTEPHTVTADDGSFDSHPDCLSEASKCMLEGDKYEKAFSAAGEYPYYCRLHGGPGGAGMAGVVIVKA